MSAGHVVVQHKLRWYTIRLYSAKKAEKIAERQAKQAAKVVKEVVWLGWKKRRSSLWRKRKKRRPCSWITLPRVTKRCVFVLFTWLFILIPSFYIDMSQPMGSGCNPSSEESAWYDWWESKATWHSRWMKLIHLRMPVKALSLFSHRHQTLLGLWTLNTAWLWPFRIPWFDGALTVMTIKFHFRIDVSCTSRNRMLGKATLFVPGFNYAGISIQSVVEKRLYKTSRKTRHDLGRQVSWDLAVEARVCVNAVLVTEL